MRNRNEFDESEVRNDDRCCRHERHEGGCHRMSEEGPFEERCCHRHGGHHGPGRFHGHHGRPPFDPAFFETADLHILLRAASHSMHHARFGNSQDRILKILSENETMDQMELRHRLHVRPGSMSEIISKLEDKGLVLRERNEEDRRHATLSLSEEGRKAAGSIEEKEEVRILSENEEKTLRDLLLKLIRSSLPEDQEE